jgi:nucleoside permease NupC
MNKKGLSFMFGNFSNAVELLIFCFDILIASATVFPTTFICSFGNHSSISVFLYNLTGAAKNHVDHSIALVSNCSGYGSILHLS